MFPELYSPEATLSETGSVGLRGWRADWMGAFALEAVVPHAARIPAGAAEQA